MSLDEYDVYDNATGAEVNVNAAREALDETQRLAEQIGDLFERMQGAISEQGYRKL